MRAFTWFQGSVSIRSTACPRLQHVASLDESSESTGTDARLGLSAWALATRAAVSARNPNQVTCRRAAVNAANHYKL
jgi:hypothetical protein